VAPLLDQLADVYKKMPNEFLGDPVAAVKNSIHVSPFYEEDLGGLVDLIGVDRILFGSDYPHPEGLSQPTSYVNAIQGLAVPDQAKIMGGNLARLIPA
jgi:predicted TIM-barrel fold metal-dependent hydrolase